MQQYVDFINQRRLILYIILFLLIILAAAGIRWVEVDPDFTTFI